MQRCFVLPAGTEPPHEPHVMPAREDRSRLAREPSLLLRRYRNSKGTSFRTSEKVKPPARIARLIERMDGISCPQATLLVGKPHAAKAAKGKGGPRNPGHFHPYAEWMPPYRVWCRPRIQYGTALSSPCEQHAIGPVFVGTGRHGTVELYGPGAETCSGFSKVSWIPARQTVFVIRKTVIPDERSEASEDPESRKTPSCRELLDPGSGPVPDSDPGSGMTNCDLVSRTVF